MKALLHRLQMTVTIRSHHQWHFHASIFWLPEWIVSKPYASIPWQVNLVAVLQSAMLVMLTRN